MTKLSNVRFTGESGQIYTFTAFSWDTNFEEDFGAVYFVTERSQKSDGGYSHKRIYVGETGDLSSRFDSHHKQSCFDREGANCICVYEEQDEDERPLIEQDLLAKYNPPCND